MQDQQWSMAENLETAALKIWNKRLSSSSSFLQPSVFTPCLCATTLITSYSSCSEEKGSDSQALIFRYESTVNQHIHAFQNSFRKTLTALYGNLMQVQLYSRLVGTGSCILQFAYYCFGPYEEHQSNKTEKKNPGYRY